MPKGCYIKISLGALLCGMSQGFIFAQLPEPHWFTTPDGIGIVRLANIQEAAPLVLFTSPEYSTAYDTITFNIISEPYPELPGAGEKISFIYDFEGGDTISISIRDHYCWEEAEKLKDELYSSNRSGKWYFESVTNVVPLNWYEGMSDYHSERDAEAGLARMHPELSLRAVGYSNRWVEVIVNEDSGATAFIREDETGKHGSPFFIPWEYYLTHVVDIKFNPPEREVYKKPKATSSFTVINTQGAYVAEVCGQWVLLERRMPGGAPLRLGWTKWHDGKKVSVRVREYIRL